MSIERQQGDFSRRAARVLHSVYWSREDDRVARLAENPTPAEWVEILKTFKANRDEKQVLFKAIEKAKLFEKLPPEMQALFLTAEEWQDSADDSESNLNAKMEDVPAVTPCIMDQDEDELSDRPKL